MSTSYRNTIFSIKNQPYPSEKNSTTFRRGIPDFRQNNRKLGGKIGYFERTFMQDFKNIGEKIHFLVLVNATGD